MPTHKRSLSQEQNWPHIRLFLELEAVFDDLLHAFANTRASSATSLDARLHLAHVHQAIRVVVWRLCLVLAKSLYTSALFFCLILAVPVALGAPMVARSVRGIHQIASTLDVLEALATYHNLETVVAWRPVARGID